VLAAYLFLPAHRGTDPLDRAPESLVVPGYFDEVFFQGQGFPVRRDLVREGVRVVDGATIKVIRHFPDGIDDKNIQETPEQVEAVNAAYAPQPRWQYHSERRTGHYKCMSTSTSMVADWFALERGAPLPEYVSHLDGKRYRGFDPEVFDALYYREAPRDTGLFKLTDESHLDPVSGVRVPYSVAGFATILGEETSRPGARRVEDDNLPVGYDYDLDPIGPLVPIELFREKVFWPAFVRAYPREASERLRRAVEEHGPVLAGIKMRFSVVHGVFRDTRLGDLPLPGPSGHGVVIVGWIEKADRLYFLYRETFGACDEEREECGPAYRIYPIYGFNEAYAFQPAASSRANASNSLGG